MYYLNDLKGQILFKTYALLSNCIQKLAFIFKKLVHLIYNLHKKNQLKLSNVLLSSFVFNVSKSYKTLTIHRKDMKLKEYVISLKKVSKQLKHFYQKCIFCSHKHNFQTGVFFKSHCEFKIMQNKAQTTTQSMMTIIRSDKTLCYILMTCTYDYNQPNVFPAKNKN